MDTDTIAAEIRRLLDTKIPPHDTFARLDRIEAILALIVAEQPAPASDPK